MFDKNNLKKAFDKAVRFLKSSHRPLYLLIVPALFFASAAILYSAPPATKYQPGETLDPTCGPGDSNCSVEIGSSYWDKNGTSLFYTAGNIGLGTDSPSSRLDIAGDLNIRGVLQPSLSASGEGRVYFDQTSNTFKVSENGGAYVDLLSGGGGGSSLWTLHSNGEDIFRNVGNVGINTTNPTTQFESTSNSVAGWFRGVPGEAPGAWDFSKAARTADFQLDPAPGADSYLDGAKFSPDGLKMFTIQDSSFYYEGPAVEIVEYGLTTPWDVETAANSGNSYEAYDDLGVELLEPSDIEFSADGRSMYLLAYLEHTESENSDTYEIYEYSLSAPWSLASGNITYDQKKVFNPDVMWADKFQFNGDGTMLFVSGGYDDGGEGGDIWAYTLASPFDVSTIVEPAIGALPLGDSWYQFEQMFAFDSTGERFFAIFMDSDNDYRFEMVEYTLDGPWNVMDPPLGEEVYLIGDPGADFDYSDLMLRPDGMGFHIAYVPASFGVGSVPGGGFGTMGMGYATLEGGVYQYTLNADIEGGTVIVDGRLGVGVNNPQYKLHVNSGGDEKVAMFSNINGSCWVDPSNFGMDCSSDKRLKTDILSFGESKVKSSLSRLNELEAVTYRWAGEGNMNSPLRYGFIAQQVQEVFPELVSKGPFLDPDNPSLGHSLGVSYTGFTPFIIDAIQELNDKVDLISAVALSESNTSTETGGSLIDIILRAAKNSVVTAKEFVANKIRTKELCLEDEAGETTCINRKDLDDLLRKSGASSQDNPPTSTEDIRVPEEEETLGGGESPQGEIDKKEESNDIPSEEHENDDSKKESDDAKNDGNLSGEVKNSPKEDGENVQ